SSRHGELVLLGELFGAEDGDDVLEVSVALEDSLYSAGRVVVLLTDDARVEDSREGCERVDGRVEGLLDERAIERDDGVEVAKGGDDAGIGPAVGGDVDRLAAGDGAALRRGDPLHDDGHDGRASWLIDVG